MNLDDVPPISPAITVGMMEKSSCRFVVVVVVLLLLLSLLGAIEVFTRQLALSIMSHQ